MHLQGKVPAQYKEQKLRVADKVQERYSVAQVLQTDKVQERYSAAQVLQTDKVVVRYKVLQVLPEGKAPVQFRAAAILIVRHRQQTMPDNNKEGQFNLLRQELRHNLPDQYQALDRQLLPLISGEAVRHL